MVEETLQHHPAPYHVTHHADVWRHHGDTWHSMKLCELLYTYWHSIRGSQNYRINVGLNSGFPRFLCKCHPNPLPSREKRVGLGWVHHNLTLEDPLGFRLIQILDPWVQAWTLSLKILSDSNRIEPRTQSLKIQVPIQPQKHQPNSVKVESKSQLNRRSAAEIPSRFWSTKVVKS